MAFHEIILGDNPAVSKGLPITIAWESFEQICTTVDEYECERDSMQSPRRRTYVELFLPATLRDAYLRSQSYTRAEIADVNRTILEIQKSRIQTAATAASISTTINKGWKTLFIRRPMRN